MRVLTMLAACLMTASALAQATATPRGTDPNLIFDLLGTVTSFDVTLTPDVNHAFVVAVRGDRVVLEAEREADGEDVTLTVSAGALAEVRGCSVLLFIDLEFAQQDGLAGNRSTRCMPPELSGQVLQSGISPLGHLRESLELPLDRWLAVDAFAPERPDPTTDSDLIGDDVVFYLYLSTQADSALPTLPGYETWQEVHDAFR